MVNPPPENLSRQLLEMQRTVERLQHTVRLMKEHRQRVIDQRRRRIAIIGGGVSLLLHIILLIYLSLVYRAGISGGSAEAGTYQLAILTEEELTELEDTTFDDLETEAVSFDQSPVQQESLPASSAASAALTAAPGAVPALAGSGDGAGDMGLGGGGGTGTTSFFGIGSKGTRFAFIIDVSGSMGQANKLVIAKRELTAAVNALPDYAFYYVLLFNTTFAQPPNQKGWTRARNNAIRQLINWLERVDPGGGTEPRTSFLQVFALEPRPDVIYFLTDGQFKDITAEEIATLNRSGKRAVINTIQFGDRGGEELLRQIARASGGVYRFVPAAEGF